MREDVQQMRHRLNHRLMAPEEPSLEGLLMGTSVWHLCKLIKSVEVAVASLDSLEARGFP
jgi:hypothetical protein